MFSPIRQKDHAAVVVNSKEFTGSLAVHVYHDGSWTKKVGEMTQL